MLALIALAVEEAKHEVLRKGRRPRPLEALGKVSSNGGEDDSGNIMERARKQMCDADSLIRVAKLKSDVVNLCLEEELSHMQSEADAMMGKLSMFSPTSTTF